MNDVDVKERTTQDGEVNAEENKNKTSPLLLLSSFTFARLI